MAEVHHYVCIVCRFIIATDGPWKVLSYYKCPSCGTVVELRAYTPSLPVEVIETEIKH
jgi:acetone carboxylase gamma subunit